MCVYAIGSWSSSILVCRGGFSGSRRLFNRCRNVGLGGSLAARDVSRMSGPRSANSRANASLAPASGVSQSSRFAIIPQLLKARQAHTQCVDGTIE